jgi:hypothetical protein
MPRDNSRGAKMQQTLEDTISEARARALVLKVEGHGAQAAAIERVCTEIERARGFEEYLCWLPEDEAVIYTNRTVEFLRARFGHWEQRSLAQLVGRTRFYRRCALESRAPNQAAFTAGRHVARYGQPAPQAPARKAS